MSSLSDRELVWMALSDLFVDHHINHEQIANQVAHLTISEVEQILFHEVAPVCMSNLLMPTPTVCEKFSENYVLSSMQQHLAKMQSNGFYHRKVLLKAKFYKVFLKQDWLKLMARMRRAQKKQANELQNFDF
ncbi:hypothetical protein AAIR29_07200 [Psychrobacter sp. FBL11]|uniref:DUF7079 domain-containing protein n=1 Tax=Psychrobacter saeujeotis TaxID=3143436 RepID=A0ABU9X7N4_9GAMM|nr:hypothetical protein [uncultured Psychrobacter sp.]